MLWPQSQGSDNSPKSSFTRSLSRRARARPPSPPLSNSNPLPSFHQLVLEEQNRVSQQHPEHDLPFLPLLERSSTDSSTRSSIDSSVFRGRGDFEFEKRSSVSSLTSAASSSGKEFSKPPLSESEREARLAYARTHAVPASALYPSPEGTHVKVGGRWNLLRWEELRKFLMDPENTRMLDDDDVIKRTARILIEREQATASQQ